MFWKWLQLQIYWQNLRQFLFKIILFFNSIFERYNVNNNKKLFFGILHCIYVWRLHNTCSKFSRNFENKILHWWRPFNGQKNDRLGNANIKHGINKQMRWHLYHIVYFIAFHSVSNNCQRLKTKALQVHRLVFPKLNSKFSIRWPVSSRYNHFPDPMYGYSNRVLNFDTSVQLRKSICCVFFSFVTPSQNHMLNKIEQ